MGSTCALDTDPNGLDGLMTGCVYIIVGWVIMLKEGNCGGYKNHNQSQFWQLVSQQGYYN